MKTGIIAPAAAELARLALRPRTRRTAGTGIRSSFCSLLVRTALVAGMLGGCHSGSSGDNPRAAPQLVRAMISDPKTFNPVLITDAGSSDILANVFEGLVRLNTKSLAVEPLLAERWETSADGTVWTFHLRPGVRWHDGTPLTAGDVVFTFDAIYDPRVPNSSKHVLTVDGQPIRAEAVDEKTVRLTLPRPFAPLLTALPEIIPRHRLGEALKEGRFTQEWGINSAPETIVGTGPYRIRQYVPSQFVRLERNPDYWMRDEQGQPLPYLDQRTVLLIPDMDSAYLKFLAGQTTIHAPRPEEIAELRAQADQLSIQVEEIGLSTASQFVVFNRNPRHYGKDGKVDPKLSWFTDSHFLRAIAHAMDKPSMVLNCLSGYGQPAITDISPSDTFFYNPELKDYAYDLDAARAELAAGGYRLDGSVLRDRDGNAVELSLTTNSGNKIRERIATILQEDWAKLGIKANYRPVDFTTLVEKLDTTFDWDAILIGFTSSPDPHNSANLLRSNGNLHMWNPNQPKPETEWEAEIDRLVEAGSRELDRDKRRAVYWRIQAILHEQLPMIQTVRAVDHVAYRRNLQNLDQTVWGINHPERLRFAP